MSVPQASLDTAVGQFFAVINAPPDISVLETRHGFRIILQEVVPRLQFQNQSPPVPRLLSKETQTPGKLS